MKHNSYLELEDVGSTNAPNSSVFRDGDGFYFKDSNGLQYSLIGNPVLSQQPTLVDNLLYYYRFDSDGTFPDELGSKNGTIDGATYSATGLINGAYDFDGTDDKIYLGSGLTFPTNTTNFSISLWYNSDNNTDAVVKTLIGESSLSGGQNNYHIFYDNRGGATKTKALRFGVGDIDKIEQDFLSVDNAFNETTNVWHHIVAVRNGTDLYLYKDGALLGSLLDTAVDGYVNDYNHQPKLGACDSGAEAYWEGKIDEVGIWTKALSLSQIQTLYNSGNGLRYD